MERRRQIIEYTVCGILTIIGCGFFYWFVQMLLVSHKYRKTEYIMAKMFQTKSVHEPVKKGTSIGRKPIDLYDEQT